MKTYILEGGVGKHIAFSALIPALAKRDDSPIQVYTPYVEVFAGNPMVRLALESTTLPLDDPRILASEDIIFVEPYKSSWQKGGEHIIAAYARLLGVTYRGERPKMFTEHRQADTQKALEEVDKPFIVVQFNGGQSPTIYQQGQNYTSTNAGRNYPTFLAQALITQLQEEYPDHIILNWSLPNEQQFEGAVPFDVPFAVMHEVLKQASGVIGVDSCLMHLAESAGKSGVYIWGNTRINQFGYAGNDNLTFHGETTYSLNDPRNVLVDPEVVVAAFDKHYGVGK